MFKAFISLGWACVTAASMGKYGLRDGAYPFDWVRSQLNGVLHFLENDFEDFLCREHLSEDGKIFYDRKWELNLYMMVQLRQKGNMVISARSINVGFKDSGKLYRKGRFCSFVP